MQYGFVEINVWVMCLIIYFQLQPQIFFALAKSSSLTLYNAPKDVVREQIRLSFVSVPFVSYWTFQQNEQYYHKAGTLVRVLGTPWPSQDDP